MHQPNDVRSVLEAGGVAVGAKLATYAPALVETYGSLGLDWVWVDFEHAGPSPWDGPFLDDLCRAAEVSDTELLVRVPAPEPALIRRVLDAGVSTLVVPRIDDARAAYHAVAASRFDHDGGLGDRGLGDWRATDYGTADHGAFIGAADGAVVVGVIVETRSALEHVEEIADVPGLGFLWIGRNDLSIQLGHPGDPEHPDVAAAVERIEAAAAEADVPLAGVAHDADLAAELVGRGYRMVRIGGELDAVREVLPDRLDRVRETVGTGSR